MILHCTYDEMSRNDNDRRGFFAMVCFAMMILVKWWNTLVEYVVLFKELSRMRKCLNKI